MCARLGSDWSAFEVLLTAGGLVKFVELLFPGAELDEEGGWQKSSKRSAW